jgi:hypothetical protein
LSGNTDAPAVESNHRVFKAVAFFAQQVFLGNNHMVVHNFAV